MIFFGGFALRGAFRDGSEAFVSSRRAVSRDSSCLSRRWHLAADQAWWASRSTGAEILAGSARGVIVASVVGMEISPQERGFWEMAQRVIGRESSDNPVGEAGGQQVKAGEGVIAKVVVDKKQGVREVKPKLYPVASKENKIIDLQNHRITRAKMLQMDNVQQRAPQARGPLGVFTFSYNGTSGHSVKHHLQGCFLLPVDSSVANAKRWVVKDGS